MKNRRDTLLWMKDLLDHMARCHSQLEWAGDDPTRSFLAESLMDDLAECQKLCEELRGAGERGGRPARSLAMS